MKLLADRKSAKEIDLLSQEMGIEGLILMERAALKIAERVKEFCIKQQRFKKIVALCGVGNNGGDGLAAIRILTEWGYEAEAILFGKEENLSEQMKVQIKIAKNSGIKFGFYKMEEISAKLIEMEGGIFLDALFGVGLTREIEGEYKRLIEILNERSGLKIAVDVPSGVNADNGRVLGCAAKADLTITFGFSKVGVEIYPGKEYSGKVEVYDIGFPKKAMEEIEFPAFTYEKEEEERLLPKRREYSNKGSFGKVLIIAGSEGMSGASFLSALAAYKNGAGLVKLFTTEANRVILQTLLPEAIIDCYEEKQEEKLSKKTRERMERNLDWADVVVVGSGIGKSIRSRDLVKKVLEREETPVIFDADGILLLKEEMRGSFMVKSLRKNFILTPHIKELSILLDREISDVKNNIMEIAKEFQDAEGVLVIKEAKTVVTGRKKCYINSTGNSAMAKAGSGDVLTGFIAAHFALGGSLFEAASLGVFFHGLSGDRAREEKGIHSVLARDLA